MKGALAVALLFSVPVVFSAPTVMSIQVIFFLLVSVLNLSPIVGVVGFLAPFVLLQFGGTFDPTLFLTILGL